MSKQVRNTKINSRQTSDGIGHEVQHQEAYEDSLLPKAEEIIPYIQHDPDIITWIKGITEKEQEHRHKMDFERTDLIDSSDKRSHHRLVIAMLISLVLGLSSLCLGTFLIIQDDKIAGYVVTALGILLTSTSAFKNAKKK